MNIIQIYESASTDGYKSFGDGVFFDTSTGANAFAKQKHGGYAVDALKHLSIMDKDGRYYLLKDTNPISLYGSRQAGEDMAKAALAKLTPEERKALGI